MTVSPLAGYLERFQLRVATWERVPALIKVYLVAAAEILFIILWQLLRTVDVKFEVDSWASQPEFGASDTSHPNPLL
jgi:hypothetical protein